MNTEASESRLSVSAYDRLLLAFANLRSYGIDAVIVEGEDPEQEMDRLQRELRSIYPDATGCCLVAMESDLGCFNPEGELVRPLLVRQRGVGVKAAARAALRQFDLDAFEIENESELLVFDPGRPAAGNTDVQQHEGVH